MTLTTVRTLSKFSDVFRNKVFDESFMFVSYDATALFPNIPIGECIELIYQKLLLDDDLHNRTKLTPDDIRKMMHLCLSTSYFIYGGKYHTTQDSGPIGLLLMVTNMNIWMMHTLDKAVEIGCSRGIIIPTFIKKYVDDILALITKRRNYIGDPIEEFLQCLNAVHPRIQFTFEKEVQRTIPFLDCLIKRHLTGQVVTTVYRKPTDTNIVIKAASCHDPRVLIGAFKTALCRTHRLCSTPDFL
jgi:hypothetical protein